MRSFNLNSHFHRGRLDNRLVPNYMMARSPKFTVRPGTTVILSGSPCCRLSRFSPLNVKESPRNKIRPSDARKRVTPL